MLPILLSNEGGGGRGREGREGSGGDELAVRD